MITVVTSFTLFTPSTSDKIDIVVGPSDCLTIVILDPAIHKSG